MTKRQKIAAIRAAMKAVNAEIASNSVGKFGRGLASEGYAGGYLAALSDALLIFESDTIPNTRHYWTAIVRQPEK